MKWISIKKHGLPKKDASYFVMAESADPDMPLFTTAWFDPKNGWSLILKPFVPAITHWCLPERPKDKKTESRCCDNFECHCEEIKHR